MKACISISRFGKEGGAHLRGHSSPASHILLESSPYLSIQFNSTFSCLFHRVVVTHSSQLLYYISLFSPSPTPHLPQHYGENPDFPSCSLAQWGSKHTDRPWMPVPLIDSAKGKIYHLISCNYLSLKEGLIPCHPTPNLPLLLLVPVVNASGSHPEAGTIKRPAISQIQFSLKGPKAPHGYFSKWYFHPTLENGYLLNGMMDTL